MHNYTSSTHELSVYLNDQQLQHECHPTYLRMIVLQRILDKECMQAEKRKEIVDQGSQFYLGHERQHSMVICSAALVLSRIILCPSLVTLCSDKSAQCAVELYNASHLWYPLFYTSPMGSSALQHWTISRTKEGYHWQGDAGNHQTWYYQSSLISLAHHYYDWHTASCYDCTCKRLTAKVNEGITQGRLTWSILT